MKRFVLLLLLVLIFVFPKAANADEGWIIDRFKSDISIEKSGQVSVFETIDVDFNTLSKHGIYRDIPYVYEFKDGKKNYTEISVREVLQNNFKAKYKTSQSNGYARLKIGDPDRTISGKNSYKIEYTVRGVLRGFSDYDELYWNVTGNNWPVSISTS